MAEYHLLTIWQIEAPLEEVYAVIHDSPSWPGWWPGVQRVELIAAGEDDGIDSVWRYTWRGPWPYLVVFDVRTNHIERLVSLDGMASGDLTGIGRWHFSCQGTVSVVRFEWHVRSTKWWMNLLAPFVRSLFIRNHMLLMTQGGQGLAQQLGSPLVGQENIDLMAEVNSVRTAFWPWHERG